MPTKQAVFDELLEKFVGNVITDNDQQAIHELSQSWHKLYRQAGSVIVPKHVYNEIKTKQTECNDVIEAFYAKYPIYVATWIADRKSVV